MNNPNMTLAQIRQVGLEVLARHLGPDSRVDQWKGALSILPSYACDFSGLNADC